MHTHQFWAFGGSGRTSTLLYRTSKPLLRDVKTRSSSRCSNYRSRGYVLDPSFSVSTIFLVIRVTGLNPAFPTITFERLLDLLFCGAIKILPTLSDYSMRFSAADLRSLGCRKRFTTFWQHSKNIPRRLSTSYIPILPIPSSFLWVLMSMPKSRWPSRVPQHVYRHIFSSGYPAQNAS